MFNFFKKSFFFGGFTAIVIAVFVLGIYLGYNERPVAKKVFNILDMEAPAMMSELNFGPFWEIWNLVENNYVLNEEIERQEMLWGAMAGIVSSLEDPYSVFFPPADAELFESSVRGDFEGVGMEIGKKNNALTVIAPLKDTPAYRAGIKAGDKILEIDGRLTLDLSVDEAALFIRGERGTEVVLTVAREGEEGVLKISIVRDVIEIPVLDTEKKENGVFVIKLYNFSARSANEFRGALREMIESESNKLILDLRGNTGGYLEIAIDIASWFLPLGEVVAQEEFVADRVDIYRSRGYDIFNNLPFVVLVNGGSASASEIVAGALQEHGVAKLVGTQTYGKGSVQQLFDMDGGTSLKLTVARWLTPNGVSISENGLTPDFEAGLTDEDEIDKQMEKAIEILNNWE